MWFKTLPVQVAFGWWILMTSNRYQTTIMILYLFFSFIHSFTLSLTLTHILIHLLFYYSCFLLLALFLLVSLFSFPLLLYSRSNCAKILRTLPRPFGFTCVRELGGGVEFLLYCVAKWEGWCWMCGYVCACMCVYT